MEDDFKPVIQPQRRLNPKVQDVVKNEIVKLLDSVLIYPISDSSWVSPIHVVLKKGGMTVVLNDNNELIPSCTISIALEDQEKTTFTCPYGTFAYRRMPFGLCNAPATFQQCMTTIFHDMVEDFMEVFMDDFWNIPFELMCDASDYAVGAVLRELLDGKFKPIYYTSKMLNNAQEHYTTSEKELLAVVFAFDKSHPYLILSKTMIRESPHGGITEREIADEFPDEHLMMLKAKVSDVEPWYADYVNYIVGKVVPPKWTSERRKGFYSQVNNYFWDEPYAFKL
ncbi:reverse transcriptase domain-containing protein [Tanacetum coccineum]